MVVVSGDLAFRGDLDEYHQFKEDFYDVIKKGFDIEDDCIVVCPGNHDIIRDNTVICKTPKGKKILYPRPDSEKDSVGDELESLRKYGEDIICREIIGETVDDHHAVHFHDYIMECCEGNPQNLVRLHIPEKWPWVHFAILNSAWDCRDNDDEGKLRIGLDFLNELLNTSCSHETEGKIICALFHHPHMRIDIDNGHGKRRRCNWLTPSEQSPTCRGGDCFVNRLNNNVKCIMNGHVHEEMEPKYLGNELQTGFWSICGTLFSNDTSLYHCRVIKIRRGGSLSYIDLTNADGNPSGDWTISFKPGNPTDRELLKREEKIKEKLQNKEEFQELSLDSPELLEWFYQTLLSHVPLMPLNSELICGIFDFFLKEMQQCNIHILRRRRR